MAITLIVEDGTGFDNSNTYVSVQEARTYAENRGQRLGTDDSVAAMLIKATDYLESFECKYSGERVTFVQALAWPRVDSGFIGIPKLLKAAQCQAVISQSSGIVLQPDFTATNYVTKEVIGPITTEYADPMAVGLQPMLSGVESLLLPLFGDCSTGGMLKTVRV